MRALGKTLDTSRHLLIVTKFDRIEREFGELDRLSVALVKEAERLKIEKESDVASLQKLAGRLAGFYRQFGELERELDAEVTRLQTSRVGLRTG